MIVTRFQVTEEDLRESSIYKNCPRCKSIDISYGDIDIDDDTVIQKAACCLCGLGWSVLYDFAAVDVDYYEYKNDLTIKGSYYNVIDDKKS